MAAVASVHARWPTARDWSAASLGPVTTRAPSEPFGVYIEPSQTAPRAPERGHPMSTHTPVCELLGIEHPIVQAPLSADPRLPAAVSNAGALGSVALWSTHTQKGVIDVYKP